MQQATWKYCSSSRNKTRSKYEIIMITKYDFPIPIHFKVDGLQIIVVAKKYIYVSQLFISRMPKMLAIPQLVSVALNPIPISEPFRGSHPPCEHSRGQHI